MCELLAVSNWPLPVREPVRPYLVFRGSPGGIFCQIGIFHWMPGPDLTINETPPLVQQRQSLRSIPHGDVEKVRKCFARGVLRYGSRNGSEIP
jgi:hypothetical protein